MDAESSRCPNLTKTISLSLGIVYWEIQLALCVSTWTIINNFLFLQGYFWKYLGDRQHLERFPWVFLLLEQLAVNMGALYTLQQQQWWYCTATILTNANFHGYIIQLGELWDQVCEHRPLVRTYHFYPQGPF